MFGHVDNYEKPEKNYVIQLMKEKTISSQQIKMKFSAFLQKPPSAFSESYPNPLYLANTSNKQRLIKHEMESTRL